MSAMTNGPIQTMTAPSTSRSLVELAEQHADLRTRIARCEQLADDLDAGKLEPDILLHEIIQLRAAFDTHNHLEERLLHPVLLDADWMGAVRVSRMVEDHVEEHRALHHQLGTPTTWELRRVLTNLRTHLDSEDRGFLNPRVLR